jgi:hypothetical protein
VSDALYENAEMCIEQSCLDIPCTEQATKMNEALSHKLVAA